MLYTYFFKYKNVDFFSPFKAQDLMELIECIGEGGGGTSIIIILRYIQLFETTLN